jgi:hypothetical protein
LTLAVILKHKRDLVTLIETVDACALERADVNEHVLGTILGRHKTVALGRIEEFHGTRDAVHGVPFPMGVLLSQSPNGTPSIRSLSLGKGQTAGGALF